MGIIINNSGKFEDVVLLIAKRQTYRHRDRSILTLYTSCDVLPLCDVPFGCPMVTTSPETPRRFFKPQPQKILKPAYCQNYCIDSNQICTAPKTTKCLSWVAKIRRQQIQDGGRPLFWKPIVLMKFSIVESPGIR